MYLAYLANLEYKLAEGSQKYTSSLLERRIINKPFFLERN